MKIVFLTRRFYPHIGGVEKHILKISKELIHKGHTVTIIAENHDSDVITSDHMSYENMPVIYLKVGSDNWFKKFRVWLALMKYMGVLLSADVIHAHDVFFWYLPFRFLFFWKPVFTTFHGDEKEYPPRKNAIRMRRISEFLSKGTISVGSYLSKWYRTHSDVIIWGAVEAQKKDVKPSVHKPLRLLLLGRLDPDISIDLYCGLFDVLKRDGFAFELTVCGDGPLRKQLEKYGDVLGFVEDVNPYIQKTDIVLCSSYLAILESLSYQKGVIALYDNPMKKDYLTMTPWHKWICITDDIENAKKYVDSYKPQDHRKNISTYCQSVSWSSIADIYLSLWKK